MEKDCWIYIRSSKDLENPDRFAHYFQGLASERREKIEKVKPSQEKRLSLAAGILLDVGLQSYGLKESEMMIATGVEGKPYFPDRPDIRFSLSHSGTLAMAAFSDYEVGCDIQQMREMPPKRMQGIASRFFCPEETEWMTKPDRPIDQKIRFYRLWVLKESYLKLTGQGLKSPMNSFYFSINSTGVELRTETEGEYQIQEYSFGGYRAAVIFDFT